MTIKLLSSMTTEEELLDYRIEMMELAAPYLERIRAIDVALARLLEKNNKSAGNNIFCQE